MGLAILFSNQVVFKTQNLSCAHGEMFIFLTSLKFKTKEETNALSFYRSQNVLGWSKCFVPNQKFIYILWQSQTFCARQRDDLHSVKLVFVSAQNFLNRH